MKDFSRFKKLEKSSGQKTIEAPPSNKKEEEFPKRFLPLYAALAQTSNSPYLEGRNKLTQANTGLLFDKFVDIWSGPKGNPAWEPEKLKKGSVKERFLAEILSQHKNNKQIKELLDDYNARRKKIIETLKGEIVTCQTNCRFVSGLSMGHVLDTGFVWHRLLSVPYLPGSSVKGLIRAWADPKTDKDNNHPGWGTPEKWEGFKRLFGDSGNLGAGALIVFDAIPETQPRLELDIMNPHYGEYYSDHQVPPADYLHPKPIFFLTVAPGAQFNFAIAPRPGAYKTDEDQKAKNDLGSGITLLKEALVNIGAGAKTAAGYGYFE